MTCMMDIEVIKDANQEKYGKDNFPNSAYRELSAVTQWISRSMMSPTFS